MEQTTIDQAITGVQAIKQAVPDYPIHPLLAQRWSPRSFADRVVEDSKLLSILEAARWSASAGNGQPWYFVVAARQDLEFYNKLASVLTAGNAEWAAAAPVLMLTVAKMITSSGRPHRHAFHDVGLATQNLTLQATALGLYVHPMAGFSAENARLLYAIPEEYEPVTMLAIGYLGDPQALGEQRRQQELAPRTRKPLAEFVFGEMWGQAAHLVEE
jgi:nitroreductase